MSKILSIADVHARLRQRGQTIHQLDTLEPVQIAARLIDIGWSPRTAADAAEVAYSVAASLRTGIPVPPRWGWGG